MLEKQVNALTREAYNLLKDAERVMVATKTLNSVLEGFHITPQYSCIIEIKELELKLSKLRPPVENFVRVGNRLIHNYLCQNEFRHPDIETILDNMKVSILSLQGFFSLMSLNFLHLSQQFFRFHALSDSNETLNTIELISKTSNVIRKKADLSLVIDKSLKPAVKQ